MAEKESWLARQRGQRPWLDHLVRAYDAFNERYGNHYAAAITYFSVLSLFPLVMIAFAIMGFVLAGNPVALENLKETITDAAPAGLGKTLNDVVDQAIESRSTVGVIGLLDRRVLGAGLDEQPARRADRAVGAGVQGRCRSSSGWARTCSPCWDWVWRSPSRSG